MPCFIRQIRKQRIRVPENVSLFNPWDVRRIEEELKSRLNVNTHEELHQKIEEFIGMKKEEELRKTIEDVLNELSGEKEQSEYPDRFKEQRRKWREMQQRAVAPA